MTPTGGSHGKLHSTTKILSHASRRRGGGVALRGACATGVVVGVLGPGLNNSVTGPGYQVFLSELRKLGFTEGQNLVVEYRRIGGARDYVYHSTGKRVRDLPITMEKLL